MLVYGDTSYEASLEQVRERLRMQALALSGVERPDIDALRGLLIAAGQAQQAAQDDLPHHLAPREARRWMDGLSDVTDAAAAALYARWAAGEPDLPPGECDLSRALARFIGGLDGLGVAPDATVTEKVPEGFAFYALYPEQYALAALRWAKEHPGADDVLVVGIRSIGTTLSALSATALAATGRRVRRLTVRPEGSPFERGAFVAPEHLAGAAWALIEDEGPGLSGSSMVAAAEALCRAGLDAKRMAFLPGHGGGPGSAASEAVRAWWARVPSYTVRIEDLSWDGETLADLLMRLSPALSGSRAPAERLDDLGAGAWRALLYPDPDCWPAIAQRTERPKVRCALADGTAVLWKFAGLVGREGGEPMAEEDATEIARRAAAGWTVAPLGTARGFLATPWVEGTLLRRAQAGTPILKHIGRYIAGVAAPPLRANEQAEALARLTDMVLTNTREALGDAAAQAARRWCDAAALLDLSGLPGSGDGRLAPHEWVRVADGRILKTDGGRHDVDHSIAGLQPVAWDLAGAIVEWDLNCGKTRRLLAAYAEAGGAPVSSEALAFYRIAYAAFRLGQCELSAWLGGLDGAEEARLKRAAAGYQRHLERLLRTPRPEPEPAPAPRFAPRPAPA